MSCVMIDENYLTVLYSCMASVPMSRRPSPAKHLENIISNSWCYYYNVRMVLLL